MGFRIEVHGETADATITVDEPMTRQLLLDSSQALWTDPRWNGRRVLCDARESRVELSAPELRGFAEYVLETQPSPPPEKVAFVVGRGVDFGLSRIFETYRQDEATQHRVFRELEEAASWLAES